MRTRLIPILAALALILAVAPAAPVAAQVNTFYREAVLFTSAAITADSAGDAAEGFAPASLAVFKLNCTAITGTTPTMDAAIQASYDGGTTWDDLVTFTQITTTPGSQVVTYADVHAATEQVIPDRLRAEFDVGGTTPSYTCSVHAIAKG